MSGAGIIQRIGDQFERTFGASADAAARTTKDKRGLWKPPASKAGLLASLLLILLLAAADCLYRPQISFALFYLLSIALAAWAGGWRTGVWATLLSLPAAALHEIRSAPGDSNPWAVFWGLATQSGSCLFAVLLVSAVRDSKESLELRIQRRTAALEQEIGERKQTEERLQKTMQQLRQLAENIGDTFWMRESDDLRLIYASPAYELTWGRSCRDLYRSSSGWLDTVHPEDQQRVADAVRDKQSAGQYNLEYRIMRPDGELRRIRDRAFPIRDVSGKVVRIVGIVEDITERHRLEREILEISDREQARLGQDLHDSLCQKLVSAAFDNSALKRRMAERPSPEIALVQQMGAVLNDAITEARAMSRGLFPVQLETDGLTVALRQMAAGVNARSNLQCQVLCPQPVAVRSNALATQLYRVAQEAVNNAVKHSKATVISIQLTTKGELIELCVSDNGVGIPVQPGGAAGMGLHIMDYRARTIGGTLHIQRGPDGGTIVSCSAPQQLL